MSTDVSEITEKVSGLTISGPAAPAPDIAPRTPPDAPVPSILERETADEKPTKTLVDLPPAKDALFESSGYRNVPVIDGQAADELAIAFSGSVKYEASDPAGQKLFHDLTLGKSVTLRIEGFVGGKAGTFKLAGVGTDNEREAIAGKLSVKVTDLYALAPEDM